MEMKNTKKYALGVLAATAISGLAYKSAVFSRQEPLNEKVRYECNDDSNKSVACTEKIKNLQDSVICLNSDGKTLSAITPFGKIDFRDEINGLKIELEAGVAREESMHRISINDGKIHIDRTMICSCRKIDWAICR